MVFMQFGSLEVKLEVVRSVGSDFAGKPRPDSLGRHESAAFDSAGFYWS